MPVTLGFIFALEVKNYHGSTRLNLKIFNYTFEILNKPKLVVDIGLKQNDN